MSSTSSNHSTLLIKERMWDGWSWRDSSIGEVLTLQTTVSELEFKNHIKMPGMVAYAWSEEANTGGFLGLPGHQVYPTWRVAGQEEEALSNV